MQNGRHQTATVVEGEIGMKSVTENVLTVQFILVNTVHKDSVDPLLNAYRKQFHDYPKLNKRYCQKKRFPGQKAMNELQRKHS